MIAVVTYVDVYEVEVPDEIFTTVSDKSKTEDEFWKYADRYINIDECKTDRYFDDINFFKG